MSLTAHSKLAWQHPDTHIYGRTLDGPPARQCSHSSPGSVADVLRRRARKRCAGRTKTPNRRLAIVNRLRRVANRPNQLHVVKVVYGMWLWLSFESALKLSFQGKAVLLRTHCGAIICIGIWTSSSRWERTRQRPTMRAARVKENREALRLLKLSKG